TCEKGTPRFSGSSTSHRPKLYVVSIAETPIYVGVTKQPVRSRLRLGWNANGRGGYHGYAWRRELSQAFLDVWCHNDPHTVNPLIDMETVEAEVVFLIRSAGQWPQYQTEIHFHQSKPEHRNVAKTILKRYRL